MAQLESVSRLRVLYVEDNDLVREVTSELLACSSRDIIAVASAEAALDAFREGHFDIVITDVSLPAMSGVDLARQIKQLAPSMPIIMASGYPLNTVELRLGAGVRAIRKPFDTELLDVMIQELCGCAVATG